MELPHSPSPPTRHLDILFYSAPSSPRSSAVHPPVPTDDFDFEFDFSGHLTVPILSAADELFHAGKILPLTPQPSVTLKPDVQNPRGRANDPSPRPGPRRGRAISRSLSPLRVSEFALQQQQQQQQQAKNNSFSSRGPKKWRLRDLLLFRSASEGSRPLKKYPSVVMSESTRFNVVDDTTAKISSSSGSASFRSAIGEGSSRRRSAHEIHYAANPAVSEDLKKKTSLPFKYGLLGCLGFNLSSSSGFRHFSKGFVSLSR